MFLLIIFQINERRKNTDWNMHVQVAIYLQAFEEVLIQICSSVYSKQFQMLRILSLIEQEFAGHE